VVAVAKAVLCERRREKESESKCRGWKRGMECEKSENVQKRRRMDRESDTLRRKDGQVVRW